LILTWVTSITADEVDDELQRAREALDSGRLQDAEQGFRELIAQHPGLADAYAGLADTLQRLDRTDEALSLLLEAGQGLVYAGDEETGRDYLRRAVEISPNSAAARAALGYAELRATDYAAAVRDLRRAIELGQSGAAVQLYLGAALWESGQLEEAERIYRRLLDREPTARVPTVRALGGLLLWQGRYEDAVPILEEAARAEASSAAVQFDLARALAGAGRDAEAIAAYRRVVELAPRMPAARYGLATLLARAGETAASREQFDVFQQLHEAEREATRREGMLQAKIDRGWELMRDGRWMEAAEHFRSLEPTPDTLAGLAAALSAAADPRGAAAALERALALAPEREDLRRQLADVLAAAQGGR
jgi:tetratricopeptide (TPR) repeat protein